MLPILFTYLLTIYLQHYLFVSILFTYNITKPNCALDRRTILCLYSPGFQKQIFKHVKILSKRSTIHTKHILAS